MFAAASDLATNPVFCLSIFVLVAIFAGAIIFSIVEKGRQKERDELAALARKHARAAKQELLEQQQQLLEQQQQLKAEYSKEYEERKLTIGTIKCSQCEWSGQWGTGMTYEQFFAGNLFEAGIDVARQDVNNDNLSRDNRQYTCPVCNSSGWQKA